MVCSGMFLEFKREFSTEPVFPISVHFCKIWPQTFFNFSTDTATEVVDVWQQC